MRISDWSSYVCSSDLAGDSGKGFAVVASEVKDLAQETSKATASIAERVAAIQTDASEALDAIGRVSETIQRIAESQHTIASAVEEQSATRSEEHTSELQSLMRISYAVFCLKQKTKDTIKLRLAPPPTPPPPP